MARARKLHDRWRRIRGGATSHDTSSGSSNIYTSLAHVGDFAPGRVAAAPDSPPDDDDALPILPAPLAAIDAGSNTIHMAVMRPAYDGHDLRILKDAADLVQLGADVTAIGAIGPERAAAAIAAIRSQVATAQALGATTILGIATEGVRKAANAKTFLERVEAETGLRLRLITGDQEAALAYWGATSETPQITGRRGVIDLGGGSLELIVGQGSRITWRASLPLGGNVIRSRFLPSDPPTFRELSVAYQAVTATLAAQRAPTPTDVSVCGGTATALAQMARRALGKAARPDGADGADSVMNRGQRILTCDQLDQLLTLTLRYSAAELATRYHLREARARLMAPGCVALLAAAERFGVERLHVSKRGIREGALLAYLHAGADWLDAATSGRGWRAPSTASASPTGKAS